MLDMSYNQTKQNQTKQNIIYFLTVKWLNSFIWPIDVTLISDINPSQSGPWSNGNEEVLHILRSITIGGLIVISRTLIIEFLPCCRDSTAPADSVE